ncbi:LuxR C-terminal-related transcriptional regulator [Nocardioides sp. CCNWLW239]|uniref:helix-turn-helix transcriptional regulator n=1 Tax=Nocardioides sp. CCNWLW239 TaxID=3128902 RepID=UPI003018D2CB
MREIGPLLSGRTLSPVAGAVRPLIPELKGVLPAQPLPLDDRGAERHQLFRGLVEILDALGPAVLILEDLHWTDEQTVDFLRYLLSGPPSGLAVVLSYRGEEATVELRGLTASLDRRVAVTRVLLDPFDADLTGQLAAAILGTDTVSSAFATYLAERSSGLPLAVEELLALMRARGTLVLREEGGWARRALDDLGVPSGIRDSVLERVGRLSEPARRVVEVAATLQTPVPVPALLGAIPDPEAGSAGVAEALGSGLLTEFDGRIGMRHALAAQAVCEGLDVLRRQEMHDLAAGVLRRTDPVPLGQLAHHLLHAARYEDWVRVAEQAADQAIEIGNEDEAANLLEDVLARTDLDAETRGRIAVKLGRAALEAARPVRVIPLLTEVLEGTDLPAPLRGELRFWLAMLMYLTGADEQQTGLFTQAVEDLADRPDLRAWAMVNLGMPVVPGVPLAEHLAWLGRAQPALDAVQDRSLAVFLLGKVGMVRTAVGDRAWRETYDRILELTGGRPRGRREVSAFDSISADAVIVGHHTLATGLVRAALAGAAELESRRPVLYARSHQALVDYCTGTWRDLDQHELLALAEEQRDVLDIVLTLHIVAGSLALVRGELDEARRLLGDALAAAHRRGGSADLVPLPASALIRLHLAEGDPAAAEAEAARTIALLEADQIWPPAARALPALVDALSAAGNLAGAAELTARFGARVRDLDAPFAGAALPHAQGVLAAADGRLEDAAGLFDAAAGRYAALPSPYDAAQAHEQAARCLLEAGTGDGAGRLRAAIAAYEALGARWDRDRAANLARAHGVGLPSPHRRGSRGYGTQLSPRESEVARLAGAGQRNQEIADRLFISINTVKKHLAAAMRKLEVGSRTELIRLMTHHPAAGPAGSPDDGRSLR